MQSTGHVACYYLQTPVANDITCMWPDNYELYFCLRSKTLREFTKQKCFDPENKLNSSPLDGMLLNEEQTKRFGKVSKY